MSKKTVAIIGAGGPAGVGLSRCLTDHYRVLGDDSSQWSSLMMEVEQLGTQEADMTIAVPDSIVQLSTFRPAFKQIELCQDKAAAALMLDELAPKTYWVRDTHGAGGKGAQMASELLPGKNYSVEFVCFSDEKLARFQKERVSYLVSRRTNGLEDRGSSAVSVCTNIARVWRVAEEALQKLTRATETPLHGFYGVDLKCDERGVPKVTEINAGRLLTASYALFSGTGYNLPLVGVNAFFEMPTQLPAYPVGWGQIRQVGQLPKLFPPEVTKDWA